MALIMNVLWFILGGFLSALAWLLAGCILAITIIGIPWAPAAFRLAGFSAAPFGREVVSDLHGEETNLLLNIVWLVLAGWWLALHHLVLAVVLAVSLIGIPFAIQHVKLAMLSLAPVGKTVLEV